MPHPIASPTPPTGVLAALLVLAVCGALTGRFVAVWLRRAPYRYPEEELAPPPRAQWPPVVLAVLWPALAWVHHDTPALAVVMLMASVLGAVLAGADLDVHRLPDRIQLPAMPVSVVAVLGAALIDGGGAAPVVRALAAAAVLALVYLALALLAGGALGLGDVKLAALLGLLLGRLSWAHVLLGGAAGWVVGGLVAVTLLALRRVGRHDAIPFGPSMLAGAALALLVP